MPKQQTKGVVSPEWVDDRELIKPIRDEIWQLVRQAPNMETVHWYVAVDDCFENSEFHFEDFANLRWRLSVLRDKGEPIGRLYLLIEKALPVHQLARELEIKNESE